MKRAFGILFGVALVSSAWAQSPNDSGFGTPLRGAGGSAPNPLFDLIDADGDGAITTRELRKAAASLKQLDVDKDGKITKDEAAPGPGGRIGDPTAMVERALENDKDGDGKLSKAELPRHLAHLLGAADANSDGSLDRAELTMALANVHGQPGSVNGGGGAGYGSPQGGFGNGGNFGGGAGDPRPGVNLSQYDRNGDGSLSADEMPTQMRGMLSGSDQNGNGQLDPAEVQAISQRMNERLRSQRPLPPGVSVGPQGVKRSP
jgi:Ca2+-binding EF-hand superfamily protein